MGKEGDGICPDRGTSGGQRIHQQASGQVTGSDPEAGPPAVRPQSILLALLGDHVLGRGLYVYSGSYIEALTRVGVSEQATRSTLTRMVNRGLLQRRRKGRRMYFGLTPRSEAILRDGGTRMWDTGAVNTEPGQTWTLVGFSLPEAWHRSRHDLRSGLAWAGFGMLHAGLWIAPSQADVTSLIAELGLQDYVRVFAAQPIHPADLGPLIRDAFHLADLTGQYQSFLHRWDRLSPLPGLPDDLARELLLMAEWLRILRADPRLPVAHLPADWPASRAQQVFRQTHATLHPPAARIAEDLLETIR
jgi:phenylacetic acid degradation operon negative regulatory protein